MDRPAWNKVFMDICQILSNRSSCIRLKTAAILVKDNNIISIGYNGSCSKAEHCADYWLNVWNTTPLLKKEYMAFADYLKSESFLYEHHQYSNKYELHAEMNCVVNAAKNSISSTDSIMYSLVSPCQNCAKLIIAGRIKKVYYSIKYDRNTEGIDFLISNGVQCVQFV